MISYSEIGGHVLTPFLGTCPGRQDKMAVFCLQEEVPRKERLNVTKSIGGDVSVPMAMMRKSVDDYGKGICR